jgi:hypothetical protein
MENPKEFAIHFPHPRLAASILLMCARLCGLLFAVCLCSAQNAKLPSDERVYNFGVTVVASEWLKGDIYLLDPGTPSLPNFKNLKSVGSVYTPILNIKPRKWLEGFPGITDRFEWFALDYNGKFWVKRAGKYRFALESDDGSKLYIDSKTVVDNDGTHATNTVVGEVKLSEGLHTMRVSYFQGPRYDIALVMAISEPDQQKFFVFNIDRYQPPPDKLKDGSQDKKSDSKSGKKSKEPLK